MKRIVTILCIVMTAAVSWAGLNNSVPLKKFPGKKCYTYRVTLKDKRGCGFSIDKPKQFLSQKAIDRRRKQNLPLDSTDEFRNNALLSAYTTGKFTAEGKNYTLVDHDDVLTIYDESGKEYGEFSNFIIRRSNGDDTIEYEAKVHIREAIEDMQDKGLQTSQFTTRLPQQTADGQYAYDENGTLLYDDESEVRVKQTDRNYELKKVYRQSDPVFISILDHIRTSQVSMQDLQRLNQRVGAQLDESDSKLAITLSTRRG